MKTCRDCIHYTPCWKATSVAVRQHVEKAEIVQYCADFLDRRRVIELPVGLGEMVYLLGAKKVEAAEVIEVSVSLEEAHAEAVYMAESAWGYHYFYDSELGEAVHLTQEAAEAALSGEGKRA